MILGATLLAFTPLASVPARPAPGGLLAIKVARAETASHGTLEHAVILVEDGKIVAIGEDLPIERGIPVLDMDPGWVAMPGLVNCYSRYGLDGRAGSDSRPGARASEEFYPDPRTYEEVLEAGVTTLGLYPPGNGIPGRAVAVRPQGETREEMLVEDDVYLKVVLRSSSSSKKMLRDGFEAADKYAEKEKKAREKWEKDVEKAEKAKKSKKDDEKKSDEDGEKDEGPGPYVPPDPDDDAKAFMQLRDGSLRALMTIEGAADYLHLLDALGEEQIQWHLRMQITRESDLFYLAEEIGDSGRHVVMEPSISLHPNTMRQRNLPAEFARAGAKLTLIPRDDRLSDHEDWLRDTGELVAAGLEHDVAVRALTLAPAEVLGVDDVLGSLEVGKAANMIFLNGDPFEPSTELKAVMLDGHFVTGEVEQ